MQRGHGTHPDPHGQEHVRAMAPSGVKNLWIQLPWDPESALWSHWRHFKWQDSVSLDFTTTLGPVLRSVRSQARKRAERTCPQGLQRAAGKIQNEIQTILSPTTDWSHVTRSQGHLHFQYYSPMQFWDQSLLSIFQAGQIFHVGNLSLVVVPPLILRTGLAHLLPRVWMHGQGFVTLNVKLKSFQNFSWGYYRCSSLIIYTFSSGSSQNSYL